MIDQALRAQCNVTNTVFRHCRIGKVTEKWPHVSRTPVRKRVDIWIKEATVQPLPPNWWNLPTFPTLTCGDTGSPPIVPSHGVMM